MSRRLAGFKSGGQKIHPNPDREARARKPLEMNRTVQTTNSQSPLWRRLAPGAAGSPGREPTPPLAVSTSSSTTASDTLSALTATDTPKRRGIARTSSASGSASGSAASPPTPTHGGISMQPLSPDSVAELPDHLDHHGLDGGGSGGGGDSSAPCTFVTPIKKKAAAAMGASTTSTATLAYSSSGGGSGAAAAEKAASNKTNSTTPTTSASKAAAAAAASRSHVGTPKSPARSALAAEKAASNKTNSTTPTTSASKAAAAAASRSHVGTPKSPARSALPRLKVVLDMDECLIHSIFNEGVTPGRVAYGRASSGPPHAAAAAHAVESFPLTMLDRAKCLVNKRPRVDWFLEQVSSRFDTYVMTAGTRDYAEPLLDVLDPNRVLKGRFYRDSCVFHEGHYFKDLRLVDEDPRRVLLVDNNPASFVLCPANGIPVVSFYDDPQDRGLEGVLAVLLQLEAERDVRRPLRQMYGLEAKLAPLSRQFNRGGQRFS
eukprot:CAMPEP_0171989980 /NCGR_PEP_ID=MMETSP0993-20121228/276688_1 /TAXON_ID=483369 /ORGANISM="non described non described, Strain CCMP2098" /LENGTH=488 /DNA_ID=CAMNT_0012642977 /DNA_START=101 /DNA_END=1567 /DNA_ORIENTATION=+